MNVQTGQGTISLLTLMAIYSVAALTALPGLAVSPILGDLKTIFPAASELEVQLLSSLPSLLVIPFILIAGRLAARMSTLFLLRTGLALFGLSGVLYLLSARMWQLIATSVLLGAGAGLIVPLSTGLVSKYFVGQWRMRQFGYTSAVNNLTLVLATALTGWLAEVNWHLPFVVYLLPFVSLLLTVYLDNQSVADTSTQVPTGSPAREKTYFHTLLRLMALYGLATYLVIVISFNLPFLLDEQSLSSERAGTFISLFFLAVMAPGFALANIARMLGKQADSLCMLGIAAGLGLILIGRSEALTGMGCVLCGLAYGTLQPLVYDRTSSAARPGYETMALALVMSMNYVAILVCPFLVDGLQDALHISGQSFAFRLNFLLALAAVPLTWHHST